MAKQPKTTPASQPTNDALAASIENLAAELGLLREVIDSLREDFSWVTRNRLPVQLIGQSPQEPDATARAGLPAEERARQEAVDGIVAAIEAIAQGQLEVMLTALDGIQQQIFAVLGKRPRRDSLASSQNSDEVRTDAKQATKSESPADAPPGGRLF